MQRLAVIVMLALTGLSNPVTANASDRHADWTGVCREGRQLVIAENITGRAVPVASTRPTDSKDPAPAADSQVPTLSVKEGISCNWDGWQYGREHLKCWRCQSFTDTLRTYCSDGVVRRIEKTRVCIHCWDGN